MAKLNFNRRVFLSAATAAGSVVWLTTGKQQNAQAYDQLNSKGEPRDDSMLPSVCPLCPEHCPLLVRVIDGYPKKVEGNSEDPVRNGGTCGVGQALIQHLYNPDRIRRPHVKGKIVTSKVALDSFGQMWNKSQKPALISGDIFSYEHAVLADAIRQKGGNVYASYRKYHGNELRTLRTLADQPVWPQYRLGNADLVIMWGTTLHDGHVGRAAVMSDLARLRVGRKDFRGKIVTVNPHFDIGSVKSDLHLNILPGSDSHLVHAVAQHLAGEKVDTEELAKKIRIDPENLNYLFDLLGHYRKILFVPGRGISEQHGGGALVNNLMQFNQKLAGDSLQLVPCEELEFDDALAAGHDLLVTLSANPSYDFVGDGVWRTIFDSIPNKIAIANYFDETTATASLVLPAGHPLEKEECRVSPYAPEGQVLLVNTAAQLKADVVSASDLAKVVRSDLDKAGFVARYSTSTLDSIDEEKGFMFAPLAESVPGFSAPIVSADLPDNEADGADLVLLSYATPFSLAGDGHMQPDLLENWGNVFLEGWHSWLEVGEEDAHKFGLKDRKKARVRWEGGEAILKVRINRLQSSGVCFVPEGLGHSLGSRFAQNVGMNAFALYQDKRLPIPVTVTPFEG